jgi:hypothetical protein
MYLPPLACLFLSQSDSESDRLRLSPSPSPSRSDTETQTEISRACFHASFPRLESGRQTWMRQKQTLPHPGLRAREPRPASELAAKTDSACQPGWGSTGQASESNDRTFRVNLKLLMAFQSLWAFRPTGREPTVAAGYSGPVAHCQMGNHDDRHLDRWQWAYLAILRADKAQDSARRASKEREDSEQ